MPAHTVSGPGQRAAPWAHPWGHGDHAMPMAMFRAGCHRVPTLLTIPGLPLQPQPLLTCFPSRGSQGKALGSNLTARLIWGVIKMRYLIQLKYGQQTKPWCTRALQGLILLPPQWEPPGNLPPGALTLHTPCWMCRRGLNKRCTSKRHPATCKNPTEPLQPWLSCVKIFQLSALKLQLNCSNLRLSQEQRAAAALQQTPLTT